MVNRFDEHIFQCDDIRCNLDTLIYNRHTYTLDLANREHFDSIGISMVCLETGIGKCFLVKEDLW